MPKNLSKELVSKFSSHKCDAVGQSKMRAIRRGAREMASLIEKLCPGSVEKKRAINGLQSVMMHANSAIAQQYPVDPSDLK